MDYNNWIVRELQRLLPKKARITIDRHALIEAWKDGFSEEHIILIVREGRIQEKQCEWPHKIAFRRYFGKQNQTCLAITQFEKTHITVKTTWLYQGN